jgi:hypothetical protein
MVLCTIEGTVGNQERCARGELQLRPMAYDELAEVLCVTTIPTEGVHQHGKSGLVFDNQVQHHVGGVRSVIATGSLG